MAKEKEDKIKRKKEEEMRKPTYNMSFSQRFWHEWQKIFGAFKKEGISE